MLLREVEVGADRPRVALDDGAVGAVAVVLVRVAALAPLLLPPARVDARGRRAGREQRDDRPRRDVEVRDGGSPHREVERAEDDGGRPREDEDDAGPMSSSISPSSLPAAFPSCATTSFVNTNLRLPTSISSSAGSTMTFDCSCSCSGGTVCRMASTAALSSRGPSPCDFSTTAPQPSPRP